MAIQLTCPGCRDEVKADEADRGKSIKCGTCWTDVPVPAATVAQAKVVPPTAKALPAAPVPAARPVASPAPAPTHTAPKKAIPLPAAAPSPIARPVVATALPPAADTPKEPAKEKPRKDEPERKKSRFKERDRGRDDDDGDGDAPRGTAKKAGGGLLLAFICLGAVMLLGVATGVAVIVMNGTAAAAATTDAGPQLKVDPGARLNNQPPRVPAGDFNPGGGDPRPANVPPAVPPRPPAPRPQGWAEFRGKDFACDMPGVVTREPARFTFAAREVAGTTYTAGEPGNAIKVTVKELTLPPGTSATGSAFVAAAFGLNDADLKKDPNGRLVSGHPGVEYAVAADGYESGIVAAGVGTTSAFLFRYQWKANTPTADVKRDNFFASLSVLVEGGAPAARNPFERDDPNVVKPITQPWKPLENKDGFSVELPPVAKKGERNVVELENRIGHLSGKKWTTDDGDVKYHVYYHDLAPDQLDLDLSVIMKGIIREVFAYTLQGIGEGTKVDGKAATRWDVRELNGNITHGVSVRVGYRVFTLFVTGMNNLKGATVNDRQDRFLNSIKVTFDPKTHKPYADEPEWVAMAKTTGFTALIPRQATSSAEYKPFFFDEAPKGREWRADIDGVLYELMVVDFSPRPGRNQNSNKTLADLVDQLTNKKPVSGPDDKAKLGTLNASGYTARIHGDQLAHLRVAANGNLAYVARVSRGHDWNSKSGDKEFADRAAKFFDTFRLGEGVIATGGGGGGTTASAGEFAKVADAKVQPFWAGAFLPQAKEFVTFGVKDASARPLVRGVVRRYSLPDFKLKATYETASPINRVVADEGRGKLYAGTVREAEDAKASEKDNLIAIGEVQQFDLFKLLDGSVKEAETVRPLATVYASNAAFRVSGVDVSADGSAVYVSGVTVTGKAPRQTFHGKLVKWDTATGKPLAEINTDSPIWAQALSADGKTLVGVERNMDAARPSGNLLVLDATGWKRTTTVPLAGMPVDVAFRNDRAAVIVTSGQGQFKLLVGPADGDLTESATSGDLNVVRFTPGGSKLLTSAGGQATGLTLYDVDGGKAAKLTPKANAPDLGGLFVVSPDGKLAVTNTGVVLDLEKSKAK